MGEIGIGIRVLMQDGDHGTRTIWSYSQDFLYFRAMKDSLERAQNWLQQFEAGLARLSCREQFWLDAPFQS